MKILYAAIAVVALAASPALAKGKKGGGGGSHARAADARAVGELAGKFKWGMAPEDAQKVISDGIHAKYVEMIKKEQDIYKQDQLRKDEIDEVQKVKDSYVKFDGITPGTKEWGTSIIQSEFAPRNDESMMTLWEKDQRRFLFFWHDKLYKQFIAFNAEHPVFAGKSFDDFAKLIQNRYGAAEMKFTQMKTKSDMKLDHLEWPASGDYQLYAIDQSEFYGNFCLVLFQPSVAKQVEQARTEHNTKPTHGNALIDAVTQQPKVSGDANESIVDQITGKTPQKK
ncbi:MAG TPA: hypothetical protein VHB97_03775 [Polyangia bacterium]|jgi:hypothetical protein|nr:hypothetical protein [Polyangia bacterium]